MGGVLGSICPYHRPPFSLEQKGGGATSAHHCGRAFIADQPPERLPVEPAEERHHLPHPRTPRRTRPSARPAARQHLHYLRVKVFVRGHPIKGHPGAAAQQVPAEEVGALGVEQHTIHLPLAQRRPRPCHV